MQVKSEDWSCTANELPQIATHQRREQADVRLGMETAELNWVPHRKKAEEQTQETVRAALYRSAQSRYTVVG